MPSESPPNKAVRRTSCILCYTETPILTPLRPLDNQSICIVAAVVVRRNHALVRAGARWRQGWDVWLEGKFAGALSSRTLSDLATLSRGELLAVLRPAC